MNALRSSLILVALFPALALAQKVPEPGYLYPPGGRAGTTVDVDIAGFDWTPDLQLFVFDPRVGLEPVGPLGPVLVPPPPYWFGPKGTVAPLPLPREQRARLTLPADLPPGPIRWTVANANGVGLQTGTFWVGSGPEVLEAIDHRTPQVLPVLPVTVCGRLARNEEVDRYRFRVPKTGPVTCEVLARRLGVDLHAAVTVRAGDGRVVADAVDTEGRDLSLTFSATAGTEYTLDLHDLDFRGDRSFVYRLTLTPGPRVVATLPAVGKRGTTGPVRFVGLGVATGKPQLESVVRTVTFPADPQARALPYALETPWGSAPAVAIPLGDREETLAEAETPQSLAAASAVTGVLETRGQEARFRCTWARGDIWDLALEARRFGSPLDVALAVLGPDGRELARNDDLPGTTDAGLTFTVPADGVYTLVVSDQAGRSGSPDAVYRLVVDRSHGDFTLHTAPRLNVLLGSTAELLVNARRAPGHKEPIALTLAGLPEGVRGPANLVIPPEKNEWKILIEAEANAPAVAALVRVTGTAGTGPKAVTRVARVPLAGNRAPHEPDAELADALVLATVMKPRVKLIAVEADGGRKVHRGTTHPAEVVVQRLEGFTGEVRLQMASLQSYQRQGISGPDLAVPPGVDRVFYPCFMPEWLETTRTSRMALVGVTRVPDARGRMRHLVTPMNGQITMSIEGSLLKVGHDAGELRLRPGDTVAVPVRVQRSPVLAEPVRLELRLPDDLAGLLTAEPVVVPPGRTDAIFRVTCAKECRLTGEHPFTIRGTALQGPDLPVISETDVTVEFVTR